MSFSFDRRKVACAGFIGALFASAPGRADAQTANPPPNWMAELPSVDKVKASIPPGKDEKETSMRQAAACGVLEDLIELFTGKSDVDLAHTQQPPEAYARSREYIRGEESYRGGPRGDVWGLAASKAFREEALAKTVSPAMQRAYWEVRSVTMAARERRRQEAVVTTAQTAAALPTIEQVLSDMKGENPRDSDQRAAAAFGVLQAVAGIVPGEKAKASAYHEAFERYRRKWPSVCSKESGCDEAITGDMSRAYWCFRSYNKSPEFIRWVLNRYPLPSGVLNEIMNRDAYLVQAANLPPPPAGAFKAPPGVSIISMGLRACTASGQFPEGKLLANAVAGGSRSDWREAEEKEAFSGAMSNLVGMGSPAGSEKPTEYPDVPPHPSVAIAQKAGVDMHILGGIPLGAPMRKIAPCGDDVVPAGKTCVAPPAMAATIALASAGGVAPPPGGVFLRNPGAGTLNWVRVVYGEVNSGVLVRVGVSTEARGALEFLKKKYGPPKKGASDQVVEWIKPGLHIKYSPPTLDHLPSVPGPAPTHRCVPGTDCDGFDEMKADFWSALPNVLGAGAALKAATRPNLVFEVQTKEEVAP